MVAYFAAFIPDVRGVVSSINYGVSNTRGERKPGNFNYGQLVKVFLSQLEPRDTHPSVLYALWFRYSFYQEYTRQRREGHYIFLRSQRAFDWVI